MIVVLILVKEGMYLVPKKQRLQGVTTVQNNFKRISYTKIMPQCIDYHQVFPLDPFTYYYISDHLFKQTNHRPGLSPNSKFMESNVIGNSVIFVFLFPTATV